MCSGAVRRVRSTTAVIELVAMTAVMLSYMWLWQDSFPGDFWACVALYLAIGISSHVRRGETAREIGFRLDNLGSAFRLALVWIGPLIVLAFVVGMFLDSIHLTTSPRWHLHWIRRFAWGTLQQYGLLCFFYRRLVELLPGRWPPMLAAAGVFAVFHLPNPFLVVVTLGAGVLSVWLYRRTPNVWVLGLFHGLLASALSRALPAWFTGGMRVGPGFFEFMRNLAAGSFGF
jgi:membrane protease YdiL (CAAX protease family)